MARSNQDEPQGEPQGLPNGATTLLEAFAEGLTLYRVPVGDGKRTWSVWDAQLFRPEDTFGAYAARANRDARHFKGSAVSKLMAKSSHQPGSAEWLAEATEKAKAFKLADGEDDADNLSKTETAADRVICADINAYVASKGKQPTVKGNEMTADDSRAGRNSRAPLVLQLLNGTSARTLSRYAEMQAAYNALASESVAARTRKSSTAPAADSVEDDMAYE